MSYAYSELYIDGAQRIMGDMFDFAVHGLQIDTSDFFNYFIVSGMAYQFEIGNPTYIAGKNGCEIARDVAERCHLPIPDVEDAMYPTYHEMDITAYVERMTQRCMPDHKASCLKRLRAYANYSQSQLARVSGVPLRQIQLFAQGKRDIRKTQGDTLLKLARALHCQIEDLLQ